MFAKTKNAQKILKDAVVFPYSIDYVVESNSGTEFIMLEDGQQ